MTAVDWIGTVVVGVTIVALVGVGVLVWRIIYRHDDT